MRQIVCEGCGIKTSQKEAGDWEIFDDGDLCFCPNCRLNQVEVANAKKDKGTHQSRN